MESKLAKQAEQQLIEAMRRLTPEQRLNAFLRHCELVTALSLAGKRATSRPRETPQ